MKKFPGLTFQQVLASQPKSIVVNSTAPVSWPSPFEVNYDAPASWTWDSPVVTVPLDPGEWSSATQRFPVTYQRFPVTYPPTDRERRLADEEAAALVRRRKSEIDAKWAAKVSREHFGESRPVAYPSSHSSAAVLVEQRPEPTSVRCQVCQTPMEVEYGAHGCVTAFPRCECPRLVGEVRAGRPGLLAEIKKDLASHRKAERERSTRSMLAVFDGGRQPPSESTRGGTVLRLVRDTD